jgi:hypothetical protein
VSAGVAWTVAYLAILLLWALIVLRRRGPTLWKGKSLAVLNIAFVVISIAVALLRGQPLSTGLIAFELELIIIAIAMRNKWVLLGINHADSTAVLERCFVQTRASSARHDEGYAVNCGGAEMTVTLRPNMIRLLTVRFSGGGDSRKAALVRDLFGKQFHNSLPTPRFRA